MNQQTPGLRALIRSARRALVALGTMGALAAITAITAAPAAHAQSAQFSGPFTVADAPGPLYEVRVANPRSNGEFGLYDAVIFSKVDTNEVYGSNPEVKTSHLSWFTSTLAANIDLFAVTAGDVFASEQVAAGAFISMLGGSGITAPRHPSAALGTFYLGVRVDVPPDMASFWQGSLGWLKFQGAPGQPLQMVDSYIAYDASSIVIGQVPEADTLAMALLGLGLLAARRRAGSRQIA